LAIALTIEIKIDPSKAAPKLVTENPSTNRAARYTSEALIIKINKPNVRSVIGKVRTTRIGRTKVLRTPITAPAIKAGTRPVMVMPLQKLANKRSAKAMMSARVIKVDILVL